ncbi:CLIP domain-containing serine protease B4 isoform X1 [Aedes albopictus]|uniref:CLIP domain-containing serine protease n=1 Tax=Aedes albopictus TaxID=7160 RepID=A0ABM1ZX61_AEDAL|nr:CLIP domain-containing serine protease 2-like [Aedes albopictus]
MIGRLPVLVLLAIVLQLVRCQTSNKSISNKVASEGQVCQAGDVIGRCVPIKEYPEYAAILKKQFRSAQETQYLNDRFCGYTPARKALVCKPVKINEPHCGRQFTDRIVKGNLTELDEYPWMALFQYKKPKGFGFYCGGALINTRYVLSAAHCFVGLRYGWEVIKVRLGEWDVESDEDCTGTDDERNCAPPIQEFDLERIIPHEGFSVKSNNKVHDIALVRMSGDAQYSNFVAPICLPEPGCVANMKRLMDGVLIASGWGKTENSSASRYKLYTKLHCSNYEDCKANYIARKAISLTEGQFCAQGDAGQDTCNGDSGGPLMKQIGEQARYYVTGVVSFGPSKCGEQLPGVYTKVEHYYKWIVQKIVETS